MHTLDALSQRLQSVSCFSLLSVEKSGALREEPFSFKEFFFPSHVQTTENYFASVFGRRRAAKLLSKERPWFSWGKRHIERLFVRSCELHFEDFEELFGEIKKDASSIRLLSQEESEGLRERFKERLEIGQCSDEEMLELYRVLVPFNHIESIFLGQKPELTPVMPEAGVENFEAMKKRVFVYEFLRREQVTEEQRMTLLTKVLSGKEMKKGTVFKGAKHSLYKVYDIVHGGGAFKYFLQPYGGANREHCVLYRETRPLPNSQGWFQTLLDLLSTCIGRWGVRTTFEKTQKLLTDPKMGFLQGVDPYVVAVGFSQGGCQLQQDACRGLPYRHITTIASPGIEKRESEEFAAEMNAGALQYPQRICHYIEGDDIADQFGEEQLGCGVRGDKCLVEVHLLYPQKKGMQQNVRVRLRERRIFEKNASFLHNAKKAVTTGVKAFARAHSRCTPMLSHYEHLILSNQNPEQNRELQQILSKDEEIGERGWEAIRQKLVAFSHMPHLLGEKKLALK